MVNRDVDMARLRVLIVDDEMFMRQLVVRLLSEIGVGHVTWAEDGAKAIEAIEKASAPFHAVVCDLEMPVMNGFAFIRHLREHSDPKLSRLPVIVLSGHTQESYLKEAVALGIHGFLAKPISRRKLESRLAAAINGPPIDPTVLGLDG